VSVHSTDEATQRLKHVEAVLDSFPEILYVVDPETYRVLYVNRVLHDMLGGNPIGQLCYEAFQGLEAPCFFCTNDIIRDGGRYTWEHSNPKLGRTYRLVDQMIDWPDGRRVRFEYASDITELKAAQEALHLRDLVFLSSMASISIADPLGIIHTVNPAFVSLWGFRNAAEASGMNLTDLFLHRQKALLMMEGLAASRGSWEGELTARRLDGTTFTSHCAASALRGLQGELVGYQVTSLDITARRLAEAQLESTLDALNRSNQELQQFAYMASHDLQEPLRMVASYTQLLGEKLEGTLDETGRKYIAFAMDGAERMQRLIQDLLSFSRAGSHDRDIVDVDMTALLEEVLSSLEVQIRETAATVVSGGLPVVKADRTQMVQLIQNLVQNGIKFHGTAPPVVHVACTGEPDAWHFTVTDNGIGIEKEYLEVVFQIFRRLNSRREYPGTGIGLALCRRVVERHGGRIWTVSSPGQGSAFHFTLPREPLPYKDQ
jgi:chemotaxis family two-component system sensor kinase Cph1